MFGGFKFVDPKTHHSSSVCYYQLYLFLIGILQYTRILPWIINVLGFLISKINGMGRLESYNAVAAAILGQSEVFISLKQQLPYIPKQRLYTLTAMSTVSTSIIGAYFTLIEPKYVVCCIKLIWWFHYCFNH